MPALVLIGSSSTVRKVVELSFAGEGLEIHGFKDTAQALPFLARCRRGVVLIDPGLSSVEEAYQLSGRIRNHPSLGHLPVILLGSPFEPLDRERAARAGASACLEKPLSPDLLVGTVRRLLETEVRPGPAAPDPPAPPLFELQVSKCRSLFHPYTRLQPLPGRRPPACMLIEETLQAVDREVRRVLERRLGQVGRGRD